MAKTASAKVFRSPSGVTIGFSYHASGHYPLTVDIQDQRGPRMARLDRDETRELYQWLKALMEPAEAAQQEA